MRGRGGGKGSCGVTVRPVSPRLRKKREGRDAGRGEQGRRRRRKGKGREEEEKELAAVALYLARRLAAPSLQPSLPQRLAVGGDETLSYRAMLEQLRKTNGGAALLPLPPRLFYALAAPLLLLNPKQFEAVLRMGADLAGFTSAHQLLGGAPQPFPVLPLGR